VAYDLDLVVMHEHPEWQKPLFSALEKRGVRFRPFDLKSAAFRDEDAPEAPLYFNQASPSAYVRGNTRAVPLALALMRNLEEKGVRVLNGSKAFALELSKSTQAALLRRLGLRSPRTLTFNDVAAVKPFASDFPWPALVKPEPGGSGARMFLVESYEELVRLVEMRPDIWLPDNLLLLQEKIDYDPGHGIVRMEFLGGELLYAMRVVSHGSFNLCPSELCNPEGEGEEAMCAVPETPPAAPVEFYAYKEVSPEAVAGGKAIALAGGLDVAGIELIETPQGPVFYDINANSNLRAPIAAAFGGFHPFERVAAYLAREAQMIGSMR
jgi:glutathione synthase/RimK-type ligase-like ATP-grasp enzyme